MAKTTTLKFHDRYYDEGLNIGSDYLITSGNPTKAVCVALSSGDKVVFEGKKLDYEGGIISTGIIDKMTFTDDKGHALISFTNLNQNAGFIPAENMAQFLQTVFYLKQLGDVKMIGANGEDNLIATGPGKAHLIGNGGDDILDGGTGKDILNGGKGSDHFVFQEGYGKDTIVDFDANGANQDIIDADYPGDDAIHKSGKHDVLIDFGSGDQLLLLDVKKADIDITDFAV